MTTITRTEVRKRGVFGKLVKWSFVLFNVLMAVWLISYWGQVGDVYQEAGSEAGQAGAAIGGTIGTTLLLFVWLAGAVILGLLTLFTRGKVTIIEEKTE